MHVERCLLLASLDLPQPLVYSCQSIHQKPSVTRLFIGYIPFIIRRFNFNHQSICLNSFFCSVQTRHVFSLYFGSERDSSVVMDCGNPLLRHIGSTGDYDHNHLYSSTSGGFEQCHCVLLQIVPNQFLAFVRFLTRKADH